MSATPPRFPNLRRYRHDAMACTFEIALIAEDAKYARQAALAACEEIDRLEGELSRFVSDSDVSRINALAAGESTQVGIEVIDCLELAARLYVDTGGAFDVTFASALGARKALGPALHVDRPTRTVAVSADGLRVDLGAIGKGYAIDQAASILAEWSIEAALIHSGQSSVYALGAPPAASGWTAPVRDPSDCDRTLGTIVLRDQALSGSGQRLHGGHIVDGRTGRSVERTVGAWASAPTAALADALSTAFMVISPDEVARLCDDNANVAALLLAAEGDQTRRHVYGEFDLQ